VQQQRRLLLTPELALRDDALAERAEVAARQVVPGQAPASGETGRAAPRSIRRLVCLFIVSFFLEPRVWFDRPATSIIQTNGTA